MALAAVAIHVDHHVAAELLAKLEREFRRPVEFHRLLTIHVEDRCLDHLRHVGRVGGGAGIGRHRCETDLVVDDQMDRAASAVTRQLGKVQHLGDGTLPCEGGVAVDQDRQHPLAVRGGTVVAEHPLPRAGFSFDHRVHRLKVAGIGSQADPDVSLWKLADAFVAEVIFHIAIASHQAGLVVRRELVEQRSKGFAHKIRQHVEPAAVGHPHLDFLHALHRAVFENSVEHHHRAFTALQREPLLTEKLLRQEIFESLRLQEPAQGLHLLVHGSFRTLGTMVLDPLPHPVADGGVVDVHELEADLPRIGRPQGGDHVLELHLRAAESERVRGLTAHLILAEIVFAQAQARVNLRLLIERIDLGLGVSQRAVVVNQAHHLAIEAHVARRQSESCFRH